MRHLTYIKWGSLAVALGSVALAGWFLWQNTTLLVQSPQQDEPQDARNTQIDHPLIVERHGERIIWRLQAQQAQQLPEGMRMQRPQLELFTEKGEVVVIHSDIALFDPIKRDIDFRQHVRAEYQDWLLTTENLLYLSRQDAVHIPDAFEAKSAESQVSGRDLQAERQTDIIRIAHDVHVYDLNFNKNPISLHETGE